MAEHLLQYTLHCFFVRTHISLINRKHSFHFLIRRTVWSHSMRTVPILTEECSSPRGCLEVYGFLISQYPL
jgi:hypothetical protein